MKTEFKIVSSFTKKNPIKAIDIGIVSSESKGFTRLLAVFFKEFYFHGINQMVNGFWITT
jgi:hypothetical protein